MSGVGRRSIARANRATEQAERRRCPKCGRNSSLKTVLNPGQVVTYCIREDCGYESAIDMSEIL